MTDLLNFSNLWLPLLTGVVALSLNLLPQPPQVLTSLASNDLVKWFIVFLFIWVVSGGQAVELAP